MKVCVPGGQLWCTASSASILMMLPSSTECGARHGLVVWCSLSCMLCVHGLHAQLAEVGHLWQCDIAYAALQELTCSSKMTYL